MKNSLSILLILLLACCATTQAQDVTIIASNETVCEGETVTVEISVENFDDVSAMSFPVVWDIDVLSYVTHEVQAPPLIPIFGVNSTNAGSGNLSFSWLDPSPPFDFSLADGTVVLTITYTAVGDYTTDNMSPISIQTALGFPAEVYQNGGITPAPSVFTDGSVLIDDNEVPTISGCPIVPPVTVVFGSPGTNVSWIAPTASDNCDPSPTLTPSNASGSFFPVGTTTVTYTAEDDAGNVSLPCQFDVVVVEGPAPGAFTFLASDDDLTCNDTTAEVTLTVENFDDVEGFQFAFTWDTSILTFDSLVIAPFPNSNGAMGTNQTGTTGGLLLVNWVDFTSNGVDFPTGEELMTIHFGVNVDSLIAAGFTMAEYESLSFYQIVVTTDAGGPVPSSNIALMNSTVAFVDAPPVIAGCPMDISMNNDSGTCGAVVTWTAPTATDDCDAPAPTPIQTEGLASGSLFPVGKDTIVYIVTDSKGQKDTCSFEVEVLDNEDPVAVCPATIADVVLDGSGNGTLPANIGDGSSTDNCVTTTETSPSLSFTCTDLGSQTVTLTATDGSSNTGTASCTFNVVDSTDPVAVCPATIADVVLDGSGNGTLPANIGDGSSTDNCVAATETSPSLSFTCTDLGSQTVTLTATDGSSNTGTASCTFNVVDNTDPVAVCPATIADVVLDGSGNGTLPANIGDGSSTDNCVAATETSPSLSFTCADLGSQTVTLTATDGSSNTGTASCTFNVVDSTDPVAVCPATIADVVLDGSGNGTLPANIGDGSSTDNCVTTTETSPSLSFTCTDLGSQTVTLTATDGSSNTGTASCTFNVVDNTDPVAVCPATIADVVLDGSGNGTLPANIGDGSSTDNCVTTTETSPSLSFTCTDLGSQTVTLTATDGSSNTGTASCTFNVVDNTDPVAVCPASIADVVLDGSGNGTLPANIGDGSSTDNCVAATETSPSLSFTCADLGSQTVTLTATDGSSNTGTASCTFNVVDSTDPVAVCPATIADVVLDGSGNGTLPANIGDGSSTDNCVTTTETSPSLSFTCTDLGSQTVTLTATDGSSNTGTVSCTFNVVDSTGPVADCPGNQPVNGNASCEATLADFTGSASATDNCTAPANITFSQSPVVGTTFTGSATVTITAEDEAGNTGTCTFDVIVFDVTDPVADCPGNQPVNADANCEAVLADFTGSASATDNCTAPADITFSQSPTAGTTISATTTVTITATDVAGNMGTCTFDVSIVDVTAPTITCPGPITMANDPGSCNAVVTWAAPTATDNCDASPTITCIPASGTTFPVGDSTVMCIVEDASGNKDTCEFVVTVNDTQAPEITCSGPISMDNDAGECSAVVTWAAPTTTDNCDANPTVTCTPPSGTDFPVGDSTVICIVEDASGNKDTCEFVVTVVDAEAPTLTCPSDTTINVPMGTLDTMINSIGLMASADNCGIDTTYYHLTVDLVGEGDNDASGTAFPVGTTNVQYFVVDNAGNIDSCDFDVTIVELVVVALEIDCPANVSQANDTDECSASIPGLGVVVTSGMATDTSYTYTGGSGTGNLPDPSTFTVGTTTVTYTVLNANDTVSCSFDIMVQDTTAPSITCPSPLTLGSTTGECGLEFTVGLVPGAASDNCPGVMVTTAPFSVGDIMPAGGPYDITATATDAAGLTSSCVYQLTVTDTEPPVWMDCPANITNVPNDAGECGAIVAWTEPTPSDNCGVIAVTQPTNPSGSLFPAGETTLVEYVAADAAGNTEKCSFTVTVIDVEPPSISPCPSNGFAVSNDPGECSAVVTWSNPLPDDNCGVVSFVASGIPTGNEFPVGGPYTIGYSATDEAGNTTVCMFTVTVTDTEFPQISGMPTDMTLPAAPGECGTTVTWDIPTAADNCGVQSFGGSNSPGEYFTVTAPGQPHVVNYTATDINGNVTNEVFMITVLDNQDPAFDDCPSGNIFVNVDGTTTSPFITDFLTIDCENVQLSFGPLTGADNCGPVDILQTFGLSSGATFPLGVNTLTFVATDVNSNQTTCSFNIVVEGVAVAGAQVLPNNPCEGDDVEFFVTNEVPGATYTWKDPSGTVVSNLSSFTLPAIALSQTGTFTLEVALDFCQQTDQVDVEVFEKPVVEITFNDLLCTDGSMPLVLNGMSTGSAIVTEWKWTKPDGDFAFGQMLSIANATSTDAGIYILEATSDNGCVGTTQVDVSISDEPVMPTLFGTASSICIGESLTLNGQPFAGGTVTYNWSADPLTGSGLPTPPPNNPVIVITPTEAGTYTYTYQVTVDGCASDMAEVVVQVEAAPVISVMADGNTMCLDGTTDITLNVNQSAGSAIVSYLWTPGGEITDTKVITNATELDADDYSVLVTTALGCTSTASIDLNDLTNQLPTPTITPANDSICLGTFTTINSFPSYPSGTTYTWTVDGVVQPGSVPQINVNPAEEGTTEITLVVSLDGCESIVATTQVLAISMGQVTVSPVGETTCLDGTTDITLVASADGATMYEWIAQGVMDAELLIPNATEDNEGPYVVLATNEVGCFSQTTYNLMLTTAVAAPTPILLSAACDGEELQLCAEPEIPGATYEWTGPSGIVIANSRCPIITDASDALSGDYQVSISLDGCESTSEALTVDVLMPPTANNEVVVGIVNQPQSYNVIVNDVIDGDYTISVVQDPEFGTVVYDGDGVFTYTPQEGFRETDRMAYEICYDDCPDACDIAIVTLLIRFPGDDCIVTSVITPNNDGINDELVVSCLELGDFPQNTLNVFNEWGDEVFDAAPYNNTWKGTYNGKDLPDGTYFYIFQKEPNVPAVKGFVLIHR